MILSLVAIILMFKEEKTCHFVGLTCWEGGVAWITCAFTAVFVGGIAFILVLVNRSRLAKVATSPNIQL